MAPSCPPPPASDRRGQRAVPQFLQNFWPASPREPQFAQNVPCDAGAAGAEAPDGGGGDDGGAAGGAPEDGGGEAPGTTAIGAVCPYAGPAGGCPGAG